MPLLSNLPTLNPALVWFGDNNCKTQTLHQYKYILHPVYTSFILPISHLKSDTQKNAFSSNGTIAITK